jgi:hypothetical protein
MQHLPESTEPTNVLGIGGYSIDNEHASPISVSGVYRENLEFHDLSSSSPATQSSLNAKGSMIGQDVSS